MSIKKLRQWIESEIQETKNINGHYEMLRRHTLEDVLEQIDSYKSEPRKSGFVKPTARNLFEAFRDKGLGPREADLEAQAFLDYFESCGWVIGGKGKKMVSWKSAVATWMRNKKADKPEKNYYQETGSDIHKPGYERSGKPRRIGE